MTLSASELFSTEAKFNLDLNADGYTAGPTTINGVNVGSTSQGYALVTGADTPLQVTWPDGNASASNPGRGWKAMAAKPQGDGYLFYWGNSISGQVACWQLSSSGSYESGTFLHPSQLIAEEVGLNVDLNSDSIIGHPSEVIDNRGRVTLSSNKDGRAIVDFAARTYTVKSPFDLGVGNSGTEWQILAAEADFRSVSRWGFEPTNCQILWRNNLGNFLHLWSLDSSWNWQSSSGMVNPLSADALGLESRFQLDLNGNGLIG